MSDSPGVKDATSSWCIGVNRSGEKWWGLTRVGVLFRIGGASTMFFMQLSLKWVVTLGIVLVLAVGLVRSFYRVYEVGKNVEVLENEVADLEDKKTELETEQIFRGSDSYIQTEARDKLGLVEKGDQVVYIMGDRTESEIETTGPSTAVSVHQQWIDLLTSNLR